MRRALWITVGGFFLVGVLLVPSVATAKGGGNGGGGGGHGGGGGGTFFAWHGFVAATTTNVVRVICPPGAKKGVAKDASVTARVTYGSGTPSGNDTTTHYAVTWATDNTSISAPAPHANGVTVSSPELKNKLYPCTKSNGTWKFQPLDANNLSSGTAQNVSVAYTKSAS